MIRTAIHRLLAATVAAVTGGGVYWVTADGLLAGSVALWGVSVWILLRVRRLYPDYFTGNNWSDGRWVGVGIGVVGLTAFQGLRTIPVGNGYELGLILLVLGTYPAGYVVATIAEIERHESPPEATGADGGTPVGTSTDG